MTARILDGKAMARLIQEELTAEVADFIQNNSVTPRLAAILVGDNPASEVYVRNKQLACERVGIESVLHRLPGTTSQDELLALITRLNHNKDAEIHGILLQLPLPPQIDESRMLLAISPQKDVDAFHPDNVGRIVQGRPRFLPCTPAGVHQLLIRSGIPTAGQHAVVVGRSDIVGKPMGMILIQRGVDATVTICHSRTPDLGRYTREADILIAAVGQPKLITRDMVKPGATVIDVGMNRTAEGLCGDIDFASVREVAGVITPVPGGVGPMTITMLLHNTLTAARQQSQA